MCIRDRTTTRTHRAKMIPEPQWLGVLVRSGARKAYGVGCSADGPDLAVDLRTGHCPRLLHRRATGVAVRPRLRAVLVDRLVHRRPDPPDPGAAPVLAVAASVARRA